MWNFVRGLIMVVSVVATGCSTTLKATSLDQSGRFPTMFNLDQDAVKVRKPFDAKYKLLLYVKTDAKNQQYNDFFINSFANMNVFSRVAQKSDIESLVIERKLTDKVSNVSDLIGLSLLQKQIGPFLIVEPYIEFKPGNRYLATLKALDPQTGETVLLLQNTATNWAGLDKPLFYPLLNGFLEWTANKEISVAPPATAKAAAGK